MMCNIKKNKSVTIKTFTNSEKDIFDKFGILENGSENSFCD